MVQIPIKHGNSPSRNYEPSLLCVVSRVHILTLSSKHILCLSHVLFAVSDSRVTIVVVIVGIVAFSSKLSLLEYLHVVVSGVPSCI